MRIVFIIGPQGKSYEPFYYDKFSLTKRPWLSNVPKKYHVSEDGDSISVGDIVTKRFVRIDIAVGYCLKYLYPNDDITLLNINKVTNKELSKYDLIINQFMDLLINPFIKKFEKNGKHHEKLRILYETHKEKIYPPINYENLVYDKCLYYDFLKDVKIPIAPTYCISRSEYNTDKNSKVGKLLDTAIKERWGKIFAKPVEGADSINAVALAKNRRLSTKTRHLIKNDVNNYLNKTFSSHMKYPKIVFQKFIKQFESSIPQIRMYFLGNKLQYSILNMANGETMRPKNEDPENGVNFKYYKFVKDIAENILKYVRMGFFKKAPLLITRLDFGCCLNNTKKQDQFFLNEIEFNPGLYLHLHGEKRFNFDYKVAKQLGRVIAFYKKKQNKTK